MPPPTWISSAHICSGIKSYLRAKDPLKRDRLHLTQLKRCDYRIITPWIADIGNETAGEHGSIRCIDKPNVTAWSNGIFGTTSGRYVRDCSGHCQLQPKFRVPPAVNALLWVSRRS